MKNINFDKDKATLMSRFIVIVCEDINDIAEFEYKITSYLNSGWLLHGNTQFTYDQAEMVTTAYQAMVKMF